MIVFFQLEDSPRASALIFSEGAHGHGRGDLAMFRT